MIFFLTASLFAIKCPNCNHENPDDSDFCTECGARLRFTLEVRSNPSGASFYLDNIFRGTTPFSIDNLMYGKSFAIRLEKNGFETYKTTWSAKIGISPDVQEITLKPASGTVAYEIGSEPTGATLYIARIKIGDTPLQGSHSPGTFEMKLEKKGYDTLKQDITLSSDASNKFNFNLERTMKKDNPQSRRILRYASVGLGALGIGSYIITMNKYNEYKDNKDPDKMDDLYNKANTFEGISLGLLGAGAVCLGLSFAF